VTFQIIKRLSFDFQYVLDLLEQQLKQELKSQLLSLRCLEDKKECKQKELELLSVLLLDIFVFVTGVFSQVESQFESFRELGIIYTDLKPENLMFTRAIYEFGNFKPYSQDFEPESRDVWTKDLLRFL
jgi:hypothetical protein